MLSRQNCHLYRSNGNYLGGNLGKVSDVLTNINGSVDVRFMFVSTTSLCYTKQLLIYIKKTGSSQGYIMLPFLSSAATILSRVNTTSDLNNENPLE